jgi:uncharacterized membrane protein YbaN (DUF454 family)
VDQSPPTAGTPSSAVHRSPLARAFWISLGTILVGVGIAGIILPMLPGAVFLLLASMCYVRGSDRLHDWLVNHRVLGHHVRVMKGDARMPVRAKVVAIAMIWVAVGFSVTRTAILPLQVLLVALAAVGTWFIVTRR